VIDRAKIRIRAEELGIDVPEDERAAVLAEVKRRGAEKRGIVTDAELRTIAERVRAGAAGKA
jgi:isopropylmalate/homocitrate/citramalate synthase